MNEEDQFKELMHRARSGDRDAMERLITNHANQIKRIIRANLSIKLRGKLDSDDIFQTAMKSAFRCLNDFTGESTNAFIRWLSRILINDIRDKAHYFSQEKRNINREGIAFTHDVTGCEPTPSQKVMAQEKQVFLEEAVHALPDELRSVLLLKREGQSLEEIAGRLDVSKRTVSTLYAKAVSGIKRYMEHRGYGTE